MRKILGCIIALGWLSNCSGNNERDRYQPPEPQCGNGIVEEGEFCDRGEENGGRLCASDCAAPKSGWERCVETESSEDCPDLEPIDPNALVGLTFVYNCFLDGNIVAPLGLGPIIKGFISCEGVPAVAWRIQGYDSASDTLQMIGGIMEQGDDFIEDTGSSVLIPPVDFSRNPYLEFPFAAKFYFQEDEYLLSLANTVISGWIDLEERLWVAGEFRGSIDSEPLRNNFPEPICELFPYACDSDGYLSMIVLGLEAVEMPPSP